MNKNYDLIQTKISDSINELGVNLIKKINDRNGGNNIISPLSLSTAMGMAHLGSKGVTNDEMRKVLGYEKHNISDNEAHFAFKNLINNLSLSNTTHYVLSIVNRVMAQKDFTILETYNNQLLINYNAFLEDVDFINNGFEAIKTINDWVAVKTLDKIKFIFENPLPIDTKLVIVNAVYFKGKWTKTFDPNQTFETYFYNNGNKKSTVQMMYKSYTKYNFISSKEIQSDIIELPFNECFISLFIILPHEINGLDKTVSAFSEEKFHSSIKMMISCTLNLYLPKFKVEKSYSLGEEFKSLGLLNIFTDKADLSGISTQKNLKMYEIVHKVMFEVNEDGGEAAAVTGITVTDSSCYKPLPKEFKVDHPFMFIIRDKRNNVNLFYGQINEL